MPPIPAHGPDGLLPSGIHVATPSEVEQVFVRRELGDVNLRRAVFAGVTAWAVHARHRLGPGRVWISGGFVSGSEPSDTALCGYLPDDRDLALRAVQSQVALDLLSLSQIAYSHPPPGGGLTERWPVSGLVDAHIIDSATRVMYERVFRSVIGVDGFAVAGATKGFLEVERP